MGGTESSSALVELRVDPGHHRAQLLALALDLVVGLLGAHALEVLLAGPAVGAPLAGALAGFDLAQDGLHGLARVGPDHALAAGEIPVLRSFRDGGALPG